MPQEVRRGTLHRHTVYCLLCIAHFSKDKDKERGGIYISCHMLHSHSWNALDLYGCGLRDAFLLESIQDCLWQLHLLKCLDGRGHMLSFCQDVPLLPYTIMPALFSLSDIPRWPPASLQGLSVDNSLGKLTHAHQSTCLLDVI